MVSDSSSLRPTKSVVRKALCDILRPVISDLALVDLYAGTGQVSRDLLEEGARIAYAVDRREAPEDRSDQLIWYQQSVQSFFSQGPPEPVGLVFLDPPYGQGLAVEALRKLAQVDWLKPYALVAVETDQENELVEDENRIGPFVVKRNRRYGGSRLWIFQDTEANRGEENSE